MGRRHRKPSSCYTLGRLYCSYTTKIMQLLYSAPAPYVRNEYRTSMVILQSHRTQNMILRCYPNVSAILPKHQILFPVLFQQSLYFPLLIHRIFIYILCSIRREHSSRSFALPQKSMVTWGIKWARTQGAGAEYSSCRIYLYYNSIVQTLFPNPFGTTWSI